MRRQLGLTLLELLVVLAIIGFAMAAVSLSLRDSREAELTREAQRLIAILEATRAQSRTSGIALIWQVTPDGFVTRPLQTTSNSSQALATTNTPSPLAPRSQNWLSTGLQAIISTGAHVANNAPPINTLVLGPEPIIAPARITLSMPAPQGASAPRSLTIGTDGLRPFQVTP